MSVEPEGSFDALDKSIRWMRRIAELTEGNENDREFELTRSTAWATLGNVGMQLLQFATVLTLGHILPVRDFGLVALVTSVSTLAQLLTDMGLSSAIIQLPRVTPRTLAAAFWLTTLSGFGLTALVWVLAPYLAEAYGQETLSPLLRIASLSFSLSLGGVQIGVMERAGRFRTIAGIEVTGVLVGSGASIFLATRTHSPYPLVIGPVITVTLISVLAWGRLPVNPFRRVAKQDFHAILGASVSVTAARILGYVAGNVDNFSIGKFYGPTQLGYYSRAYTLMTAPVVQLLNGASRALLPHLADAHRRDQDLGEGYTAVLVSAAFCIFPVAAVMAADPKDVLYVLLGRQWVPASRLLELLALSIPSSVITGVAGAVYQARSRNRGFLWRTLVSSTSTVIAVFVGLIWGAIGVCAALLIRSYVMLPFLMSQVHSLLDINWEDIVRALKGPIVGGAAMYSAILLLDKAPISAYERLPITTIGGGLLYVALVAAVDPRWMRSACSRGAELVATIIRRG